MKYNKIISGVLMAALVFTTAQTGIVTQAAGTSRTISTQAADAGDFAFDEDKGAITEYLGNEADVVIPSKIDGIQVEVIGSNAFASKDAVETVVIPKGVAVIEQEAFLNCPNLKKVVIPKGIEDIEKLAFFMCQNLEQVTIGSGVDCIETNTFYGCESLKEITLPNTIAEIEDYAFMDCGALTELAIPNGTNYIGSGVFRGCDNLQTVSIPNSVKDIDEDAFEGTDAAIICEEGSTAYDFALSNGIETVVVDEVNNITEDTDDSDDDDDLDDDDTDDSDDDADDSDDDDSDDDDDMVYNITYKTNGGKLKGVIVEEYDGTYSIRLPKAIKKGYYFLGWYENGKKVTVLKQGSTGDKTFTAKWQKVVKPSRVTVTSVKNTASKKMTVKFKKVNGANGYQLVYATNKNFTKGVKKITVKNNAKTIKKLKKKTTYYVKVRAYKTDSTDSKIYGKYSSVKKATIKK